MTALPRFSFFPLALLAFVLPSVAYFNIVFNSTTRWLLLLALGLILLVRGRIFVGLKHGYFIPLFIYQFWCFLTTVWSQVPNLSFLKSVALSLSTIILLSGGEVFAARQSQSKKLSPITYLLPVAVVAFLASGLGIDSGVQRLGSIETYQGLTGNSNQLGLIAALSIPYALYAFFCAIRKPNPQLTGLLHGSLLLALFFVLLSSASRSAMLCAVLVGLAFAATMRLGTKMMAALVVVAIGLSVLLIYPRLQQEVYDRYIIKGQIGQQTDLLYSRRKPWEESYEAAVQGGWFGVGVGVSAGAPIASGSKSFFDLTAVGYGREKGNSQLAVWEETGGVGFVLYVVLLWSLLRGLVKNAKSARTMEERMESNLLLGLAAGLLVQSIFEAWWTSPGSVEATYFWATIGVANGLSRVRSVSRARSPMALNPLRGLPSAPRRAFDLPVSFERKDLT